MKRLHLTTHAEWALTVCMVAGVGLAGACRASGVFSCDRDDQCRLGGSTGRCEVSGYCSFADGRCASGSRYDEYSGEGLAGECVASADVDAGGDGAADAPAIDGSGSVDASSIDARIDASPIDASPIDASPDAPTCPTSYTTVIGSKSYRVVSTSSIWSNAVNDCADDAPGATHLAVPNANAENSGLVGAITSNSWIGITDIAVEGTWLDVFGDPLAYTNWENGQPDGNTSQNCALINTGGEWADEGCSNNLRYVCECD